MADNKNRSKIDFEEALFPLNNKDSLFSYYFGCAGFLPIIGLPFSYFAIKLGYRALRLNKEKAVPGAKIHAKIGIILGYFELTVFVLFISALTYLYFNRN